MPQQRKEELAGIRKKFEAIRSHGDRTIRDISNMLQKKPTPMKLVELSPLVKAHVHEKTPNSMPHLHKSKGPATSFSYPLVHMDGLQDGSGSWAVRPPDQLHISPPIPFVIDLATSDLPPPPNSSDRSDGRSGKFFQ